MFGSGLLLNVLLLLRRRTQKLRWAAVLVQLGALVVLTVLSLTAVPNERAVADGFSLSSSSSGRPASAPFEWRPTDLDSLNARCDSQGRLRRRSSGRHPRRSVPARGDPSPERPSAAPLLAFSAPYRI